MCTFALHGQGQTSHVCTRWHAMATRSSTLALPHSARLGYRPKDLNESPSTDRPKGLPPALGDRVSTLGEIR